MNARAPDAFHPQSKKNTSIDGHLRPIRKVCSWPRTTSIKACASTTDFQSIFAVQRCSDTRAFLLGEGPIMRTTLNLDPQLNKTAKRMAEGRSIALGTIISELANKGLEALSYERNLRVTKNKSGFPVFKLPNSVVMIDLADVKRGGD
jgi:hypothetical protein